MSKQDDNPIKILQLLSNPAIGGTESFVLSLVPMLNRRGIEVQLTNLWPGGGEMRQHAEALGIPFHVFDFKAGQRGQRDQARYKSFLLDQRFDIINAYGLRVSMMLRLQSGLRPRPVLVTGLRGLDGWRRWRHVWPDRLTQGRMDWFVGNSKEVCKVRRDREKTPDSKTVCIPNGIDTDHFNPERFADEKRSAIGIPDGIVCVTVANFRKPKGHPYLLELIRAVKDRDVMAHFVLVGQGPDEAQLKETIAQFGIEDRVTFTGALPDVRPVLACADVFVLPSLEEGMPRALMEGMSMRLPSLATRVGGIPEVVEDQSSGLLVDHGDVQAGADALALLIEDADLRAKLGQAARQRIRDHFGLDAMADRFADFYRNICANRK